MSTTESLPRDHAERIAFIASRAKAGQQVDTARGAEVPTALPHDTLVLFGKGSGRDYAKTVQGDLLRILEACATKGETTCKLRIPSGGEAAQASILDVFKDLLQDVEIDLYADKVTFDWSDHWKMG